MEYDIAKRQISIPKFFNLSLDLTGIDPEMCSFAWSASDFRLHLDTWNQSEVCNSCEAWSKHDTLTPMLTPLTFVESSLGTCNV